MKIVVIGGTGLIGSKLVGKLRAQGQEAIAAAPNTGVNTLTGEGLAEVLKGASVVVDVSNSPSWEDAAVLNFFETSTRNLLTYEAAAGVGHHVALSVVGTQRLTESGYFRAKIVQEKLISEFFRPAHHRSSNSVLRVPQGSCRYLDGRGQGAPASGAFPADGSRRCRQCSGEDRAGGAGQRHNRDRRTSGVSR